MNRRFIIYDVDAASEEEIKRRFKDDMLFSANPIVNHCMGCFGNSISFICRLPSITSVSSS